MPAYGVAGFDSAAALLEATSRAVAGKDFPAMGHSKILDLPVRASEILPENARRAAYAAATGFEGIAQKNLEKVSTDAIAASAAELYEEPRYPAVIIGSSSGALSHVAAATRAPWLPQTFMIGLRREGGGIDDPKGDLEQARAAGEAFVRKHAYIQLHQMHDPSQDRLSLQYITYFRFKYRRLPPAYRQFLTERLEPGSLIIVSDCTKRWPSTRINDRYVFQFGAVGGMEPSEYQTGSERVAEYLRHYGAEMERWDAPAPDGEGPEAEWGFEDSLMAEIEEIAQAKGHRILRLSFEDAEHPSPLVADLFRDWYGRLGVQARRLLVQSFVLIEPHWTMRTGSIPFWCTFNSGPSLACLGAYLEKAPRFEEIQAMIFPHGTESVGLPSIEDWRNTMLRGSENVNFLGVNEKAYPHHFAGLANYYNEVRKLGSDSELPPPMPIEELERFLEKAGDRYAVTAKYL